VSKSDAAYLRDLLRELDDIALFTAAGETILASLSETDAAPQSNDDP
jgi:hypothetical protein